MRAPPSDRSVMRPPLWLRTPLTITSRSTAVRLCSRGRRGGELVMAEVCCNMVNIPVTVAPHGPALLPFDSVALAAMGAFMTDLHLHPSLREPAQTSKAWPFEEARKLVKRYPQGKPGGAAVL